MGISSWHAGSLVTEYAIAYLLSLTALGLFILWIWVDRSFRWVPWIVGEDLRLRFLRGEPLRMMHGWHYHAVRLLVFLFLSLLGLASTIAVFALFLFDGETGRDVGKILFAVGLLVSWLALFVCYRRLWWLAFRHHVARHLDAMKASIRVLSKHWPTEKVFLPGLGTYVPSGQHPDLLYIDGPGPDGCTDFQEKFDRISRSEGGGFSFAVGSCPEYWVHFLGEGRTPRSSTINVMGTLVSSELQGAVEFAKGWYLACYEHHIVEALSASAGEDKPQSPGPESEPGL